LRRAAHAESEKKAIYDTQGVVAGNRAARVCWPIRRDLQRAQAAAIKALASGHRWRYIGCAPVDSVAGKPWCERCAGACNGRCPDGTPRWPQADGFKRRARSWTHVDAVVIHTRHSFDHCIAYAYEAGLHVTELEFSWYGVDLTAALFERRKVVTK
jgi:hypothetical protein